MPEERALLNHSHEPPNLPPPPFLSKGLGFFSGAGSEHLAFLRAEQLLGCGR